MADEGIMTYKEALRAGREALEALDDAADSLDSAKRWGIVDILGGGFVTSLVKHSRLGDAERALTRAREALARFSERLASSPELGRLVVGVDPLNRVFDIAFDNVLADLFVQRDIEDALERVEAARGRVEEAVRRLETYCGR